MTTDQKPLRSPVMACRRLHIRRLGRSVEPRQHTLHLVHDVSAYSAAIAAFEKTLQSTMPEIPYHPMYLYCKLTLVACRVKNDSEKLRTDPPWSHKTSPIPASWRRTVPFWQNEMPLKNAVQSTACIRLTTRAPRCACRLAAPVHPFRGSYTVTVLPFSGTTTVVACPLISATNLSALGSMIGNEP